MRLSFCVRFADLLLPKIAGLAMIFQDFIFFRRVVELYSASSFIDPIGEELSRLLADPPLIVDFDVIRPGAGKAERLGIVGDGADQEPAALGELDRRQIAAGL